MSEKKYLKWYQKVAYGTGDVAGNCGYALISSFMMLYLTNSVGLNSAIIGTLMMVSKLLDGVSDIFFGGLMDKTKSKWDRPVHGCCMDRSEYPQACFWFSVFPV